MKSNWTTVTLMTNEELVKSITKKLIDGGYVVSAIVMSNAQTVQLSSNDNVTCSDYACIKFEVRDEKLSIVLSKISELGGNNIIGTCHNRISDSSGKTTLMKAAIAHISR